MIKIKFANTYDDIISVENLLEAWKEFLRGKKKKADVQIFERALMQNIISLHQDLKTMVYKHSAYEAFNISDPKPRVIHKAKVRDRLLHHAIFRYLYPFFDKIFIADSYSCRLGKGTHRAIKRFNDFYLQDSKNNIKQVWVLKCDIRKFFDLMLKQLEINPDWEINEIKKEERTALVEKFKKFEMKVAGLMGFDQAIISSGGLDLNEVDFKTMGSRLYDNLYFAGDILDFDRPSGGFSLQLCWTTGYIAGKCI